MENENFIWIVGRNQDEGWMLDSTEMLMAFPTKPQAEAYIEMLKSEMKEQGGYLFDSNGDCYGVDFRFKTSCVEFSADFPCN